MLTCYFAFRSEEENAKGEFTGVPPKLISRVTVTYGKATEMAYPVERIGN
jgi:hypothetical protein